MQAYSNPRRVSDCYSLPDLELWEDPLILLSCPECGDHEWGASMLATSTANPHLAWCPSCEHMRATVAGKLDKTGWFYWFCFPGCLPDSSAMGPFPTKAAALADAREGLADDDEDDEDDDDEAALDRIIDAEDERAERKLGLDK